MNTGLFDHRFQDLGRRTFLTPARCMLWEEIVDRAVAPNTFRGFHRIDKRSPGAKWAFAGYFLEERAALIERLCAITTSAELHRFEEHVCRTIGNRLSNIRPSQLRPYNKIRKPVDLYVEHLVAMAAELDAVRTRLVPLLFLPLDSWIFGRPELFSEDELSGHGLTRRCTYSDVEDERTYVALQDVLAVKASVLPSPRGCAFHRIYFDLLWRDRYTRDGPDLFSLNR